jgi:hypothetical protein
MNRSAGSPRRVLWRAVFVLALLTIGACQRAGNGSVELAMAPESALPDFVRGAPTQVREAYRFAIANRELLSTIPCYCGCGAMGHRNNLDCYIKSVRPDGAIEFENHAFG